MSTACDDGYIDCGALSSSSRKPSQSARHESVPLLSKSSSVGEDTSVEDLSDGTVPSAMYRCLSRSFSVGSQLSAAAASTIHEESFSDLNLDETGNARNEYLPMSRISSAIKDEGSGTAAAAVSRQSAAHGSSEKSPLLSIRGDVDQKPICAASQSLHLSSGPACDYAAIVPSSVTASYRSPRDESGYLLFRPTNMAPAADGGSLERLGPPPEIPTSAAADYIIPTLPPKQHASSAQRVSSLLLSCRPPHIAARRRGSADSWGGATSASSGPAVPPRENRDSASAGISTPLAGISSRPSTERRAWKPNLTVNAIASANSVYTGENNIN